MRAVVWIGILAFPVVASAASERIAVTVSSAAVPLDTKALGTAKLEAAVAMSDAAAALLRVEQQFGRNQKKWPAEERDKLQQLNDKEQLTKFSADYLNGAGLEVKAIEGVVESIVKEVGKSKALQMAASPDQADFAIEVLGCVAQGSNAGLGARLRPGPRLDAAALAATTPKFAPRGGQVKGGWWSTTAAKSFTAAEPFWLLTGTYPGISQDLPLSCSYAGSAILVSVEAFIKDSRAALTQARISSAPGR